MKMQTMRSLMGQAGDAGPVEATTRALLPPITSFSLATKPAPVQELPKIKDFAQKKAGEAYLAIMAGVGFRAQLQSR